GHIHVQKQNQGVRRILGDCLIQQISEAKAKPIAWLADTGLAQYSGATPAFGFNRELLTSGPMSCREFYVTGRTVPFIFVLDRKTCPKARRFREQFVPRTLELVDMLEPVQQPVV